MENQKNDNLNLLEAVVQNTEMGKNTLEQIVPMTDDVQFKAELLRQRNVYHQLNQEAHTAIEACGGTAQRHGGGGLRKGPEGLSQCRARRKAPCPKAAGVSGGQPGKAGAVLVKENPLRLTLFASSPEGRAIGKTENVSGMSKAPPFGGAGNAKH